MTQSAKIRASDANSSDYFGYSVSISGDNIVVGAYTKENGLNNSGAAYIFTKPVTGWVNMNQTAKIHASDGASGDYFGYSVCISGDNIVVGAANDSVYGLGSGSAYVFIKPVSGWVDMTQNAKLLPSTGGMYDYFGSSVSISGDNVVAGSYYNDINGYNSGSAYVFTKPVSGWANMTQTAKILPSDGSNNEYFGNSVSISGNKIMVGKPEGNPLWGSVYIFNKPVSGWANMTQTQKVVPPVTLGHNFDNYGYSVAIDSNYAIVGSPGQDNGLGAAYLMHFNGNTWTTLAKLTATDMFVGQHFGRSVGISGDNVVVGASGDDDNGDYSGSAYIFTKPSSGWIDMTQTAKILPSDGSFNSIFGNSVSISGDNIVVGACQDNFNTTRKGSAYIFTKPPNGWTNMTQTAKITASDGGSNDDFGFSVCISGDNIVIGALSNRINTMTSGAAYVFTKPTSGWVDMTQTAKIIPPVISNNELFGQSVGISGDNIVVGSPGSGSNLNGVAYVYTKPVSGWANLTLTAQLSASDGSYSDLFGWAVSISGNNILAGAIFDDDFGSNSGSAYVFVKPQNGWTNMTQTFKIAPSDGMTDDNFGNALGISGNNIVFGTMNDDDNGPEVGSVTFYSRCADVSVTQNGYILSAVASGATYQWMDCNNNYAPVLSATNQNFAPLVIGNYAVEINQNGCIDTSVCINVVSVGINDNNSILNITIQPSPAINTLYLEGITKTASVEVYDVSGKLLLNKQLNTNQIDISSLVKGLYFIKISAEEGIVVRKFVKQ